MLLGLVLIPLAAAFFVAFLGNRQPHLVRLVTLFTMLLCLGMVWELASGIKTHRLPERTADGLTKTVNPQITWGYTWLTFQTVGEARAGGLQFLLGVDGISLCLLALAGILGVTAVFVAWNSIRERVAEFHALLLLLQAGLFGAFSAFDLILFYIFFEMTLIPLFFIVIGWGGPKATIAGRKLFFYTLTGGLVILVGLVALAITIHLKSGQPLTFSIPELALEVQRQVALANQNSLTANSLKQYWISTQNWIFLALFFGFAIKTPIIPFHTWLPLAYAEAPTVGSMLMAGVLSKLGCYGLLRICVPLLPFACWNLGIALVGGLAVVSIIYGALAAISQTDAKRLVGYSSISHLGFVVLGTFALNPEGLAGGALQMFNHGIITGALFILVGILADRFGTREISELGGVAGKLPALTLLSFFFVLASAGLPGLNGFVGEVLSLFGAYLRNPWYGILAGTGIILGAWYLLGMVQKVFFGPPKNSAEVRDLQSGDWAALVPLALLSVVLGVQPNLLLDRLAADTRGLATLYETPAKLQPTNAAKVAVVAEAK